MIKAIAFSYQNDSRIPCANRAPGEVEYPNLENHAKEHEKFFAKIKSLIIELDSGKNGVLSELSQFLKHWLFDHIMNTDIHYKHFYTSLNLNNESGF